ncbi:MAG: carbamoyl phosphate synthase small subunit [Firmicutes bacterium]|nr:carbamoyl phosphate synthase small subunit [Bacillota bacterium]
MGFLILEDGTAFNAVFFGAENKVIGEVVFNTGMTGYQEVLTDPSYCGQIVVMTFPLIGNYGINELDVESEGPKVKGFIVREACRKPSNWMSGGTLEEYLRKNNIAAVEGVDTRTLTKKIRDRGTMVGLLTPDIPTEEDIFQLRNYSFRHPVEQVTTKHAYTIPGEGYHIAVMDFGVKKNILVSLQHRNCHITVFPARAGAEEILGCEPDAIVLTNGPGDPKDNMEAVETIKKLIDCKPIFGICLGHQLLALASGADTEKLKYGHRGCNHPVKDLTSGRTYITSQNHGYTVKDGSVDTKKIEITHRNLNDGTIEGMKYKSRPVFSVQFHPEACPGPNDTNFLFDEFLKLVGG